MDDAKADETQTVYTLTSLTRSAGQARRVVIAGFDAPLRGVLVTAVALLVAFLPTAILWIFLGPSALLLAVLVVGAAFYLVESRTRSGLHLRTYQAMIDKKREVIGQFICCGIPVDPGMSGFGLILQSSMPSPYLPTTAEQVDALWALPTQTGRAGSGPDDGVLIHHRQPVAQEVDEWAPTKPARRIRMRRNVDDPFAAVLAERAEPATKRKATQP